MPNKNFPLATAFHWQDDLEILHIKSGEVELTFESNIFSLYPGDIICINPGQLHGFKGITPDAQCEIFIFPPEHLLFRNEDNSQNRFLVALANGIYGLPLYISHISETLPLLMQIFSLQKERTVAYEVMTKALLLQIIVILIQKNALITLQPTKHDKTCKEILTYIQQHYAEKLTVSKIATTVGVSPTYFSTFFAEHFHVQFSEYLRNYRIEQSCVMLLCSDLSVTEIALANGFHSGSHFIRHFRRLKGTTPLNYRKTSDTY
jgi:AraC-like DNA-binding protein